MAECVVAGVDWAKDTHEVLVDDADGERLWASTVTHDEAGISRLCQAMVTLGVQRIAAERPNGLLVERLLDVGVTVLPIHPNKVAAPAAVGDHDRRTPPHGPSDRDRLHRAHSCDRAGVVEGVTSREPLSSLRPETARRARS